MTDAFICDAVRTPIGRYGGALAAVRADNLGVVPLRALMDRNGNVDWEAVGDVFYGCANQAGEDNRNVARMCALLAGLPVSVPGVNINRLCGSGMDAVGTAARAIRSGEMDLAIAGGVESMSRAPFVLAKGEAAFSRKTEMYDTTIGWRFVNALMKQRYGIDSMPETGENVADEFHISREDQDRFAFQSQQRTKTAQERGILAEEIVPVSVPRRKQDPLSVNTDEHPRPDTTLEVLAKLPAPFRENGTVTAGNASGVNDGACALLLASEAAAKTHHLNPVARVAAMATVGVEPRIMGFAPAPAARKVLGLAGLSLEQMDVI
ncbi:MAG: acetyl-CoA C-acyltransferase, partial [Gammaproteobacteria bacterium]